MLKPITAHEECQQKRNIHRKAISNEPQRYHSKNMFYL